MKHVLIIDDDHILVYLVQHAFKSVMPNFKYSVAETGKAGIEFLKEHSGDLPDLILLDINMPIMNGWDFLNEYKKLVNAKEIPIVILSSTVDPSDKQKADSYDEVKQFISKPFTVEKAKSLKHEYLNGVSSN